MKKDDKQLLFNLLKTADSYVNGYQRECFNVNVEFSDDDDISNNNVEECPQTEINVPPAKAASSEESKQQPEKTELHENQNHLNNPDIKEVSQISEKLKNVESAAEKMFSNVNKAVSEIKEIENGIERAFDAPSSVHVINENHNEEQEKPVYSEHVLGKAPDVTLNIQNDKSSGRFCFTIEENNVLSKNKSTNENISADLHNENNTQSDSQNHDSLTVAEPAQQSHIQSSAHLPASTNSGITLEQLNQKILRCTRCGLARTRNNVVPGEGVLHPDVFVIGEGPGYDEDMQGHPFVGKAGMLLDKMLHAIYLDRQENCFIGNIVKCRPPQNRNPFPDEQDACFPFLETQIHILKPKMILCLGKVAIEKIMNQKISINACHGQFFDYNGIPVMVTYHPSALLRNQELKRPAWEDLKGFSRKLDEIKKDLGEPVTHQLQCLQGK